MDANVLSAGMALPAVAAVGASAILLLGQILEEEAGTAHILSLFSTSCPKYLMRLTMQEKSEDAVFAPDKTRSG